MPTIKEIDGFKLVIYTRGEHEPRHIHVKKAGAVAIVNLGDNGHVHPWLEEVTGDMSSKDAGRAEELVKENKGLLWKRWDELWSAIHDEI